MPDKRTAHFSDDVLGGLADDATDAPSRAREHLERCGACRRRFTELVDMRSMLAEAGKREQSPRRDVVAGAVKRLRLRRQAVSNVNELVGVFVGLVRGLSSLLSVAEPGQAAARRNRASSSKENAHG